MERSTCTVLSIFGPSVDSTLFRLRLGWLTGTAALGAMYAWTAPIGSGIGPDSISYLDLAGAYLRGDWPEALNTLWSPLYPAILAFVLGLTRPTAYWEFAAVRAANFLIFLAALACFDFMLRELVRYRRAGPGAHLSGEHYPIGDTAFLTLGYALFGFSTLELILVPAANPDMLVATFVFLSTALLLRTVRRPDSAWPFPLLGIALGLGYWAKAPMFPLATVFLGLAGIHAYRSLKPRGAALRLLAALAAFSIVSGTLVLGFLRTRGYITLGDSGKLNYAWLINNVPYAHWQGGLPGSGTPAHPTKPLVESPPVFAFAEPVGGTYPPWFDPAYWYDGIKPRLDPAAHARALIKHARMLGVEIVLRRQITLFTAALALMYLGGRRWAVLTDLWAYHVALIPGIAAILMYALVRVEPRFVGAPLVLTWLGIFAALSVPKSSEIRRAAATIVVTAALGLMLPSVTLHSLSFMKTRAIGGGGIHLQWEIAQGLHDAGVQPGDRVAVIGFGLGAYWAHLAEVKIVAEICAERPSPPWICAGGAGGISEFWAASPEVKQQVYEAFRTAGAVAVVSSNLRSDALERVEITPSRDWKRIGDTEYYIHILQDRAAAASRHPPSQ